MTKQLLLASAALALAAISSTAAMAAGPWSGFYIGAHAGGTWGDVDVTNVVENATWFDLQPDEFANFSPNGVLGGAQIGYNFQMSNFVLGLELDGSAMDFDEVLDLGTDTATVQAEWLATASLRAGYALSQRSLIYVKGGYAHGNLQFDAVDPPGDPSGSFSTDENHGGWVAGGGFEHLMSDDVSIAIEYSYVDLGEDTHTALAGDVVNDIGAQIHTVTARLNWHWNPSF